jgi:hypothetical protein
MGTQPDLKDILKGSPGDSAHLPPADAQTITSGPSLEKREGRSTSLGSVREHLTTRLGLCRPQPQGRDA